MDMPKLKLLFAPICLKTSNCSTPGIFDKLCAAVRKLASSLEPGGRFRRNATVWRIMTVLPYSKSASTKLPQAPAAGGSRLPSAFAQFVEALKCERRAEAG